ncbi:valine--tRNA ligase [Nakamurella endophytica]|uniref:Valine--tRNA ligase n=1 Tax=Nakamurella endophytica TaxID=1748367 RepID=A0A917WAN1_9ACTN|nr:valine--tRNA ligase [Nakamurella endophytica]GGL84872.1 valine--tRNA ligase [Nakamurella endophytica]
MTATAPTPLPAQYDPAVVEVALYRRWLDAGYFHADPRRVLSGERRPFSIVLPPPNVTGDLHVGHALDHTIMDILARWHRMSGDEVLWLPGMDHAGIATQTVVERQLARDGKTRHDYGRELFVQKVWDWKRDAGGAILGQMKRLGDSVDWDRERFTLDEGLSAAVQTIFKRLYDDELIYRAERIINWCPGCLTALSDIEVEHREDAGELVSVRYDGVTAPGEEPWSVVIATTRVETLLGDTAVAVHPDDPRYAAVVGRMLRLPLVDREIPVVADDHVEPEFGTGAVKVTPAHDPNDFEIGRRHGLPMPTILTEDARITGTGTRFDGMDRFEARAAVKADLAAQGRVVAEKVPYVHSVGHCSRSDDVVEPRLSLQWFVRVAPLARAAGDAVRDGRTRIHPPELAARYFDWVDNMHDWTISRQLWWGHRIPVWYGPDGAVRCVGPDEEPPGEGWTQDPDVLDTWFSSALWPFSTMGWPQDTETLQAFYPTSVLVTGYDILFFWVARMMMFGLYAMGPERPEQDVVPFRTVALHGLVRDQNGKKMSKSRGNVVDPLAWIDTYGADAVRFTLARGANPGSDQAIAGEWVGGSRNFCSKLFNATRFALLNGARVPERPVDRAASTAADRWVLGRLDEVVGQTSALLGDFQFGKAAEGLYHYAWDEVCDWYLEVAKVQLAEPERAEQTREVLGTVLDTVLRLLHPFVPFVTESLWTALTGGESLVVAAWPTTADTAGADGVGDGADGVGDGGHPDPDADTWMADLQQLVTQVRRFRADQGLAPGRRVPAVVSGADGHAAVAAALTRLEPAGAGFTATATVTVALSSGTATVALDTSEAIDLGAETARLDKELAVARKDLADTGRKLGDEQFLGKAPARVVDGIRARNTKAQADIERLTARLAELGAAGAAS